MLLMFENVELVGMLVTYVAHTTIRPTDMSAKTGLLSYMDNKITKLSLESQFPKNNR